MFKTRKLIKTYTFRTNNESEIYLCQPVSVTRFENLGTFRRMEKNRSHQEEK